MHFQRVARVAGEPWAGLEEVPDRVRRDQHNLGILQGDRTHVSRLMAVHAGVPAKLTGLDRRNLAGVAVCDDLQRDRA